MLTDKQADVVCLRYQGAAQCRYLDMSNWQNCQCLRLLPARKKEIDKKVTAHLQKCKQQGIDPHKAYVAIGTGAACNGFPFANHVKHGIT